MQLTGLALAAAALTTGVLASNMVDELHGHFHQRADSLLASRQNNLLTFTGALGGVKVNAVTQTTDTARPFSVGGDTFTDFQSAAERACDDQKNDCANVANSGSANFQVSDCDTQNTQCKASITTEAVASVNPAIANTAVLPPSSSASSSSSSSLTTSSTQEATTAAPPVASTTSSAPLELVSQNAQFNFFCEA